MKITGIRIGFIVIGILIYVSGQAQTNQKLYLNMIDAEDIGPRTQRFLINNHVDNLLYFDARYIDPKKTRQVDVATLRNAIRNQIPDSLATGIAVLDWEGDIYDDLSYQLKPQSDEYNAALNAFIKAIKVAKALRPNIKWGFYGLPFTGRHKPNPEANERWIQSNNNLKPLLKQCDLLLPSLYIHGYEPGGNEGFIKFNMQQFLILGDNLNKPVIPYLWHRYYPRQLSDKSMKAIPVNEFTTFIKTVLSVSYNNKKAAGIIWWSADNYYYHSMKVPALLNETSPQNYKSYHDSLMLNYSTEILKTIKQLNTK